MNRHNRYPVGIRVDKEEMAAGLVMFNKTVLLEKPDHLTGLECLATRHRSNRYRGQEQFVGIGDRLTKVAQAFKVAGNGLSGHLAGLFQGAAPGNTSRQRGNEHRIAALWFWSQDHLVLHGLHYSG